MYFNTTYYIIQQAAEVIYSGPALVMLLTAFFPAQRNITLSTIDTARRTCTPRLPRDVAASHTEYLETGLHLTLEEVDRWMATWGTHHKREAPPCHSYHPFGASE